MTFNYSSRADFGKLFAQVMQTGIGAEVGVQVGYNALQIMRYWPGKLLCVDRWINEREYLEARILLHQSRAILVQGASVAVAETVVDNSLDFVYIDAGHEYEDIKADFEAWLPKVRVGGIVSFHDYGDNLCPGVKQFIDEYMADNPEIQFYFTTDDWWEGMEYQSGWFVKQ